MTSTLRAWLMAALLVCASGLASAADTLMIAQGEDQPDISVDNYPANGNQLLLWLPGEWGITSRQEPTAQALAAAGVQVWLPDLHGSYFIPPGRYSLNDIEAATVVRLIDAALDTGKQVYVMGAGRVAGLALNAIRLWQDEHAAPGRLMGAVLISPNLYQRTPQGGEDAALLPVVRASNTPIYILQPENAAGYWRLGAIRDALETGGAPVIVHRLMGVSDGFNTRADTRDGEEAMTARLPGILVNALRLIDHYGPVSSKPAALAGEASGAEKTAREELLRTVTSRPPAPPLALQSLDGKTVSLDQLKGKPVLINFWATWCPPCVEEIPSLDRLYGELRGQGFEILAVDVGESAEQVRAFLADKPVTFPVLLDPEGETFRAWQAYAFPTSLVLDREHRIRFAVFGAFDWASGDVIRQLQPLLDAHPQP